MSVKIIQMVATPNNQTYQGVIMGLGDDGIIYASTRDGWEIHIPLVFVSESE